MIDQTLTEYSDFAYRSALGVYLIALAFSAVYYGQASIVAERRRQRAEELASGKKEHDLPESLHRDTVLSRVNKADKTAGITQALIWLGVALHGAHLVFRGLATQRFPWGNLFEYVAVVSFVGMLIAVLIIQRTAHRIMWPWILTPVVALMFYAGAQLYAETAPLAPSLKSPWFVIHVSTVSIGAGIGLISGVASLMYVLRNAYPRGTEAQGYRRILAAIAEPLPTAEKLDAIAYRCAVWALPVFGLGILFGALWAYFAWGRPWGWDPKETISLVTWLLYAAYLHARATPGWRNIGAWINITAFATMVFNLFFINLVISGLHSYAGLN